MGSVESVESVESMGSVESVESVGSMGPSGLDWLCHRHTKDECHFVEVVWLYGFHVMFVLAWSLQLFHWRALRLFHWRAS